MITYSSSRHEKETEDRKLITCNRDTLRLWLGNIMPFDELIRTRELASLTAEETMQTGTGNISKKNEGKQE